MPKGQKFVDWTPENDKKLFLTVLAVNNVQIDYAKVAAAFRPGIPATCIQTRMFWLRKATKDTTGGSQSTPIKTISRRRAIIGRASASGKLNNKRKVASKAKDKSSDHESINSDRNDEQAPTPPATDDNTSTPAPSAKRQKTLGGNITKRVSPRGLAKKNYNAIENPFIGGDGTDGEGNRLFEKDESESEGSYASDEDYGTKSKAVKNKEAVSEEV